MSNGLTEREVRANHLFQGLAEKPAVEVMQLMKKFPVSTVHYTALRESQLADLTVYVEKNGKDIQVLAGFYGECRVQMPKGLVERGMDLKDWSSEIVSFFNWNNTDKGVIMGLEELVDYTDKRTGEVRQRTRGNKFIVPNLIGHDLKPHTSKVLVRVTS
jgi:hypothetical protein